MNLSFRRFDRLFWLVWLVLPFAIWANVTHIPWAELGTLGRVPGLLVWIIGLRFVGDYVVFSTGLGLAHWIVHRAAGGQFYAPPILRAFRILGCLLLCWPLIDLALENVERTLAAPLGAAPTFSFIPDIIVMGFGLFLLAIGSVLAEALRLKREADLTI